MIAAVVCVDKNYGIGNKNELLVHIPEDMEHFKKITSNGIVIMGRKTYDSLPQKPLPNRCNIVLTRETKREPKDNITYSNIKYIQDFLSNEEVISGSNNIFIIGGGQIYKELLPFCERVYITKVYQTYDADTFFPNLDESPEWDETYAGEIKKYNGILYKFCIYDRIDCQVPGTINIMADNWTYLKNYLRRKMYLDKFLMCLEKFLEKFIDKVQKFYNKKMR